MTRLVCDAVGDVLFVPGMEQAGFGRGRHIDSMKAKARGDRRVAVLIQVEAYRPCHWPSVPFGFLGAGTVLLRFQVLDEPVLFLDVRLDLVAVVVVVG